MKESLIIMKSYQIMMSLNKTKDKMVHYWNRYHLKVSTIQPISYRKIMFLDQGSKIISYSSVNSHYQHLMRSNRVRKCAFAFARLRTKWPRSCFFLIIRFLLQKNFSYKKFFGLRKFFEIFRKNFLSPDAGTCINTFNYCHPSWVLTV